jgi:chromosome segregation ATPase
MSHKPSQKTIDRLAADVHRLRADLKTATEEQVAALSGVKEAKGELAGLEADLGDAESRAQTATAHAKELADKLVRREATIVQQAIRLASYDHADRDWQQPEPDVEL